MDMEDILDMSIEDLFKEPDDDQTNGQETPSNDENTDNNSDMTEAVSKRINEVKRKTENDTQDRIAKELGYESYKDLQNARNKKMLDDAGIDSDDKDLMEVIDKLVEKRLADDPRMKRLSEIEKQEKNDFVNNQLKEINKFAGTNFTSIDQLSKDTLSLWEKTGNLKQAYLAVEGEALLTKKNAAQMNGSTKHLATAGGSGSGTKSRPLTEEEKNIWRSVMPDITEDELSKKTIDVE